MLGFFSFGSPVMLWLLFLVPVVLFMYLRYLLNRKNVFLRFSAVQWVKASEADGRRRVLFRLHLPHILLILCFMLLVLALADPQIRSMDVKEGVNVVLVLDCSGSMAARDYEPSRLEAAKNAASVLVENLKEKDYVGIVVFESGATTACYLTPHKDKALERLRNIEQRQGRTAIGDGLSLAVDMVSSIPNKKKVVVLLSDGVNNAGTVTPEEAVEYAKRYKVQVHTVAMGSDRQVVLGYDFFGQPQYAEPVDEATLQKIAFETGGMYHRSVDSDTLNQIYRSLSGEIEREWEMKSVKDWFIMAALVILLIDMWVVYWRYRIVM